MGKKVKTFTFVIFAIPGRVKNIFNVKKKRINKWKIINRNYKSIQSIFFNDTKNGL